MSILSEAKFALGERRSLDRLQAIVLLGGSVRATAFTQTIQRSILDLPVDAGKSILDCWCAAASELANDYELKKLALRVMVDRDSHEPQARKNLQGIELSIERDPLEYRGTGGVLKDLSGNYDRDDYLLIANAAQILIAPLRNEVHVLLQSNADVNFIALNDGTPTGLILIRCGALQSIPSAGFVDLKEQAIPSIAKDEQVEVIRRKDASGLPVRNLSEYIAGLRRYHRRKLGRHDLNPYAEDWESTFAVIEEGAKVSQQARVHDSVLLKGASAESGAVVVRSLVGPNGAVRSKQMCVEALVPSSHP